MPNDDNEKDTVKEKLRRERRMTRAVTKRTTIIASIRAVHALALRVNKEPELVPELLISVDGLGALWSDFTAEDNTVLDCLLELDAIADYSSELVPEVRGLINAAKAIAASHRAPVNDEHASTSQSETHSRAPAPFSRLPEIPLPQFNGDFHKWATFRDRFIALVDTRPGLTKIDKLYYLIGCLTDSAADAIRGIPVSADNYELAWTTLSNRFNRPRLLATSLIENLLNAPVSHQESLTDLNNFVKLFDESIALLKSLQIPDLGSFILFSIASRCLPAMSRKLFESSVLATYPSVDNLLEFARSRISILENVGDTRKTLYTNKSGNGVVNQSQSVKAPPKKSYPAALITSKPPISESSSCLCCKGSHNLVSCPQFRDVWSVDERCRWMRDRRLCFNCFSSKHWSNRCFSKARCPTCSRKHHALLHTHDPKATSSDAAARSGDSALCASALSSRSGGPLTVLLGTALIHVCDRSGTWQVVRALIDSASQISAITLSCSQQLGLHRVSWTTPVSGLAGTPILDVRGIVTCKVQPRFASEPALNVKAWVLPTITGDMPRQSLPSNVKDHYSNFALADPSFHVSSPIDMLLGADVFSSILDGRKAKINDSLPTAFSSIFGWVLIGPVTHPVCSQLSSLPVSLTISLEGLMDKFWHIEEPTPAPPAFTEEGRCEEIFTNEFHRTATGRFVVPLPTRLPLSKMHFPGAREMAVKRFESLERKLAANKRLHSLYTDFMSEYLTLGHMSVAKSPGQYYIPHHAVYRADDGDSKIRVVFDASAHGPRGPSLNQCLFQGPKLQQDIIDVLTRFRVHKFAFTADICKMYRQIIVLPEYRSLQHIVWKPSPSDELVEYELNTITYGMNCAPFLAIRVLHAIANSDCDNTPDVRDALLQQTYVDDICVGADSVLELKSLQTNLVTVLGESGLELKKWLSNSADVINAVPESDRLNAPRPFDTSDDCGTKVLGMSWQPVGDYFGCALRIDSPPIFTKRGVLSMIARIFDPLGLFAPTVFLAKYIMQRTWQSKLSWDAPLPDDVRIEWSNFVSQLPSLLSIQVPRYISTVRGSPCMLLGFCDASVRGYAAVVYIRVLDAPLHECVFLIGTKTKLAPLQPLTIPRLELNAAVLLARWMSRLKAILDQRLTVIDVCAWTDSSTVLSWLTTPHTAFKVYVSNRINQVSSLLPGCHWHYVKSEMNPADCASRGVAPSELQDKSLYWRGPDFLRQEYPAWEANCPMVPVHELPETRPTVLSVQIGEPTLEWFSTFSSYDKLVRTVGHMLRFISRCRRAQITYSPLTSSELLAAEKRIVIESQRCFLSNLMNELSRGDRVTSKPLASLCPFIDDQLIRVGGRLRHSVLPYAAKHPILLHKQSHLAMLIVRKFHKVTCHSGPRVMAMLISRQYWIMSIRSVIHKVVSGCVVCVRLSGRHNTPLMADLPASRVQECRPFSRVGVDFEGPLQMRETTLRKSRTYKVYVAVFVCFSVKATHLEIVSELSTDAFLAAFDRFVARRGLPAEVFSDCGTNFIGADKQLKQLINSPSGQAALQTLRPTYNWQFNPPSAPHFGGLWEAAVRSTKRLLIRVMGNHLLSYEELTTVVTRIEAVLNSRPITPLSNDPHEFEALTPGHFLIGQPLLAVPPKVPEDAKLSYTHRWKLLEQCHQAFWRRWSNEYLTTLQTRSKWTTNTPNVAVGDMVVIIDNQAPPLRWRLGRVVTVKPGADGVVRVAHVRTQHGELVRPIVKLVPLPK